MTDKQAFYAMYLLLLKYYKVYGLGGEYRSFDLGSFLGGMDPDFFDNGPLDPAYWADWKTVLSELNATDNIDEKTLLKAIRIFTNKYVEEFGFDLGEAPRRLHKISVDDKDLIEAIYKARSKKDYW